MESLDAFAGQANDATLRVFWMTHLLARLRDELRAHTSPLPRELAELLDRRELEELLDRREVQQVASWVDAGRQQVALISSALDAIEHGLAGSSLHVFACYDHLDRLGSFDFEVRRRYLRALLALWLSLSNRYTHLRAKIFLREDLFDAGKLGFPDATKLKARSISLEWDVESLYRVVVRHLANTSTEMRRWLQQVEGLELHRSQQFGWMPGPMPEAVQKALADRLAGPLMGQGVKKGYTYRWVPNRLQDAQVRIVPRSILSLLGIAAKQAMTRSFAPDSPQLLTPADLAGALPETSQQRVAEIEEEYPLARRLENLRGLQVMLDPQVVAERLGRTPGLADSTPSSQGEAILEELIRLGVLAERADGRIDVPDIYRYGYGIKRKGGVARPR